MSGLCSQRASGKLNSWPGMEKILLMEKRQNRVKFISTGKNLTDTITNSATRWLVFLSFLIFNIGQRR
jgi:hypothetical protein